VSTYLNVLLISTSASRNVKFSLPSFVTLATGAMQKGSFQPFFNPPDTTEMTRPTGVTTVTSSTATRPSVFPDVRSQSFKPQQTNPSPFVKNIGSDRGADFPGHVVKTKNVATDNCNNVLRHNLCNNNVNHLSFQITRKNLITWKDRLLNRKVFWMKHLNESNFLKQI
jgi:hypothetical protein